MKTRITSLGAVLVLGCLAVAASPRAAAQVAPAGGEDEKPEGTLLREQSIYIPYEKLRKVFEKEGRGVFLPYEQFQELWKAARDKTRPSAEPKPPVGALLGEVDNEATVAKDVVRVRAKLKIEVLTKGWHEIPLRLADAAITRATLGDARARLVSDAPGGYKLLLEKKDDKPELVELELEYAKAITSTPGRNHVAFEAPQAPVSRWRVRIPESGVKVAIQPMIAASEVSGEEAARDETVLLAFVGAAPTVQIDWTPKAEGATGLAALAGVLAEQEVRIQEGVTRTQTRMQYTISRAKLDVLAIEVPADQKVVNVFDPNVRQWTVETTGKMQKITAQLFEPAEGVQSVTVELEKFSDDPGRMRIDVPVVRALGVGRQQGVLVVDVAAGLRAEAAGPSGLLQVDRGELPERLKSGKWDFAYRYASVPYALALEVEKVLPRITLEALAEARLRPEAIEVDAWAVYTIERAGVFRLEWDVPAGYEVRAVRGVTVGQAEPASVDSYHLTGQDKTRLVVNLARRAMGRVGLQIRLARDLDEPDLLAPTGAAAQLAVAIPRAAPKELDQKSGRLVVYAPESLRVNREKDAGLRAVSIEEATAGMSDRPAPPGDLRPVLSFAFDREPVELALSAARRRPQVSVRQLLAVRIEDDAVKYQATFYYDVLYSGIKTLRIDVPASLADKIRSTTSGVQEKRLDPAPKDVPRDYHAWQFSPATEWIGQGSFTLAWEEKLERLGLGEAAALSIPRLTPAKADAEPVDRAWGQVVVAKAETIDVQPTGSPEGLRPIDPRLDLMPGAKVADAAGAWEFHGDWDLTLAATRYELEEIKTTSIEMAVARMVLTRADQVAAQVLYRIRSADQRLEVTLPSGVEFDSEPLRINGRAAPLERGGETTFFIPLVGLKTDRPSVVDLRYTLPADGGALRLPEFPSDPAVLSAFLCAYLPEERALLGATGPWTSQTHWQPGGVFGEWTPVCPIHDAQLLAEVCQGVEMAGDPSQGFQTDGRRYVFSTLRPTGPLGLWSMNKNLLTGLVFGVVVTLGLLMLPCCAGGRVLGVGLVVAVLIVCGAFFPWFVMHVLDGYFLLAMALVLVIWIIQSSRRVHFCAARPTSSEAASQAAPPPEPPATPGDEASGTNTQEGGPAHA